MSEKIRVVCPHCRKALSVPMSLVGKAGKCPACKNTIAIQSPDAQSAPRQNPPPKTPPRQSTSSQQDVHRQPVGAVDVQLAQQPSRRDEVSEDKRRIMAAVSSAPDKFALIEPYLMQYERPVAIAVQRQFPFSIFADIVLLTSHRLMVFKRFFTKIDMFDVNYVDFTNVSIKQGFFTSVLTITTFDRRRCSVDRLVTEQALNVYRLCQDIETKARVARRQFQLEENRSRTTTMQVNNLVAPPEAFPPAPRSQGLLPQRDISNVGDEERDPFRLGE
jgi:hypothetical protein